jgi:hypothetical protein
MMLLLGHGVVANAAVANSFLNPEKRRPTLHISVSIGVPGRRVPGLNFARKSCMYGWVIEGR